MKKSTKRRVKKGLMIRSAALTVLFMMILTFSAGVYTFREFIFIQHPEQSPPSTYALAAMADNSETPTLLYQTHRETPDTLSDSRPLSETMGYTLLPRSLSSTLSEAEAILNAYRIPYRVEYLLCSQPENEIVWLEYAGFSDGNGYYVNPETEILLCVSGNKPIQADYNGTNRITLTFDDGPSPYTLEILDILDYYGIKATFFTLGTSIEKYPDIAGEIVARGHTLACHSYTHKYESIYASAENMVQEVFRWELLVQNLGLWDSVKTDLYFRFPGGSVNTYTNAQKRSAMIQALHNRGYRIFDWNLVTNDSLLSLKPADTDSYSYMQAQFLESVSLRQSASDKIVLMHDPVPETARFLSWMIRYLLDNGYCFGDLQEIANEYYMG